MHFRFQSAWTGTRRNVIDKDETNYRIEVTLAVDAGKGYTTITTNATGSSPEDIEQYIS
jgi:hypothetical protein